MQVMNEQNQLSTRRVSAASLRALLGEIADGICATEARLTVSGTGNSLLILHPEGSFSITISRKGGEA